MKAVIEKNIVSCNLEDQDVLKIDTTGMHYKTLNELIYTTVEKYDNKKVNLVNVIGQKFIGSSIQRDIEIDIHGIPGNDLASFMTGPTINVYGNVQDGICNTMNDGKVVVHGDAGDALCYGMRGGKLFIKGDVGYRIGIHMKEYKECKPKVVIGGSAGDFFGEYMAGGVLLLLGLDRSEDELIVGDYCATGMHGGVIYIRDDVPEEFLGKEVKVFDLDDEDKKVIRELAEEFCEEFDEYSADEIMDHKFIKLIPVSKRPYGRLYSYGKMHRDQANHGSYTIVKE